MFARNYRDSSEIPEAGRTLVQLRPEAFRVLPPGETLNASGLFLFVSRHLLVIAIFGECYQTGSDALLFSAFDRTTKGFGFAAFNIFAGQQSIKRVTQIRNFGLRGVTIIIHAAVID